MRPRPPRPLFFVVGGFEAGVEDWLKVAVFDKFELLSGGLLVFLAGADMFGPAPWDTAVLWWDEQLADEGPRTLPPAECCAELLL